MAILPDRSLGELAITEVLGNSGVDMVVHVVLAEISGKLLRIFEGSLIGKSIVGMHVVEFVVVLVGKHVVDTHLVDKPVADTLVVDTHVVDTNVVDILER